MLISVSIESVDQPDNYFRHYNYTLDLEDRHDPRNPDKLTEDATFRMKEELWFENTVVFESVNFPGYYLRHQVLYL